MTSVVSGEDHLAAVAAAGDDGYAVAHEDDVDRVGDIIAVCFGCSVDIGRRWLSKVGHRNVRVLRRSDTPDACANLKAAGQWFGGRSVPTAAIAGVGVPPEARGTGLATRIMRAVLVEARARGMALSTLYPASWRLYRGLGYELAGTRTVSRIPLAAMGARPRTPDVRRLRPEDDAAVERAYASFARQHEGFMDREHSLWDRVRLEDEQRCRGWAIDGEGGLDAYLIVSHSSIEPELFDIRVRDVVAYTPAQWERWLALLASAGTTARHALVAGSTWHPLVALQSEPVHEEIKRVEWMLRIVDVAAALEARGWAQERHGEVLFSVTDPILPENAGAWRLSVADGRGRVERAEGVSPELRLDVRALAALYTGHQPASTLRLLGLAEGPRDDLDRLTHLLAADPPRMTDSF